MEEVYPQSQDKKNKERCKDGQVFFFDNHSYFHYKLLKNRFLVNRKFKSPVSLLHTQKSPELHTLLCIRNLC